MTLDPLTEAEQGALLMKEELDRFMSKPGTTLNSWLTRKGVADFYVRKAFHSFEGQHLIPTLDIANVNVVDGGQGLFTSFIEQVEQDYSTDYAIRIENIISQRFATFFENRGYILKGSLGTYIAWLIK